MPPPVFLQRVRKLMKEREMRFALVQKSAPFAAQGRKERAKSVAPFLCQGKQEGLALPTTGGQAGLEDGEHDEA